MRPPRISFEGGIYHVTVRCNNQEFFFQDKSDFLLYKDVLLASKKKYEVLVHAYCITNNHVHLLLGTPYNDNLSKFMQKLNGEYARKYNKAHGKTGHFWGGRFHSVVVESDTQFYNTTLYIESNLVRCRKVDDPAHWNWSSYNCHAYGKDDPVVDIHPLYEQLGKTDRERQDCFREMTHGRLEEKGLIRDEALSNGLIVGSKEFVQSLLDSLGSKIAYYNNHKVYDYDGFSSLRRPYLNSLDSS